MRRLRMQFGRLRVNPTAGTRNIGIARSVRLKRRTAQTAARSARHGGRHDTRQALLEFNCRRRLIRIERTPFHAGTFHSLAVRRGAHGRENEKARKLNGTSSDPPLGPPVPNWLPRQLPPLAVMNGRTCRVEPIDSTRHGEALHAAYATDREGRLWTYLPWGPYSGPEELCARIDAVRASGVRPEYALIDLASGSSARRAI